MHEERLGHRINRLARLTCNAGFSNPEACLEDIEYHSDLELDNPLVTRLGTCNFIEQNHDILIMGASGGKTYLANAFGVTAARKLYSVCYIRLPDLLGELAISDAVHNSYEIFIAEHNREDSVSMRQRKGLTAI